jgi:phosphate transport system permease protein
MSENSYLPQGDAMQRNINVRNITGRVWRGFFFFAIAVALIALSLLIYNISKEAFGVIAQNYRNNPDTLSSTYLGEDKPFDELNSEELSTIASEFFANNEARLRVLVLDWVLGITRDDPERLRSAVGTPVNQLLAEGQYPEEIGDQNIGDPPLPAAVYQQILMLNLDDDQLRAFVLAEVAEVQVAGSWPLTEAIFNYDEIEQEVATNPELEGAELKWHSWISIDFLTLPMNSRPELAGIRTGILGSLWMVVLTILFAFPLGVGAAIYLEEYAEDNQLNRIIETNISNLAGVPSIIYGILGLVIFVRAMEPITSGSAFGIADPTTANGRTLLAAALTMALLILPIIIINAQEAIRAVPNSLRQASYGLGATQWQTIWNHVLPYALPGIMTGTILAIARAIGETAPLIVVGAATYITRNPETPFSKFTVLPIQIFRWTSEPEPEFRDAAAGAIVVLLVMLLTLNSFAVILRNRFSRR